MTPVHRTFYRKEQEEKKQGFKPKQSHHKNVEYAATDQFKRRFDLYELPNKGLTAPLVYKVLSTLKKFLLEGNSLSNLYKAETS